MSARAERIEQNPVQRVVVVGVEVAAFGRVLAARIALCPREEEIVDRRADDLAALCAQDDGQLVGERGLARGGRSVDGNPRRVCDCDGPDFLSQAAEHLIAGALVHVLPRPGLAKVRRVEPTLCAPAFCARDSPSGRDRRFRKWLRSRRERTVLPAPVVRSVTGQAAERRHRLECV